MQKYIVQLTDDLTGEAIEDGAGESVRFALDGSAYTIDLSSKNAEELRKAFAPYLNAARKADVKLTSKGGKPKADKRDLAPVRSWLREQGHDVPSKGRIPTILMSEYDLAH